MIWSLVILPFAGAALAMLLQGSRFMLGATACVTLASTVLAAVAGTIGEWSARLAWSRWLELTAGMTPTSATMAVLVPVIALPVVLYAAAHEEERGLARLIALMLLFVGSMELLVVATDLLTLLIGWELVGACSWALIGHHWRDAANPASGQYAFLATRLGDLGLFVAAMAAFAGTGSFAYEALERLSPADLQIVAFGLLVSAAAKAGQVPFAPWLFRAMAGPTSVSALLHAATMVAAGAYLLIRLEPQLNRAEGFAALTLTIGLVTALAGGLVALIQNHAKKLLAASTSAHYGLMFVAVGTGYPAVALLHLVAHAAFKAALFLSAGVAGERADTYALDKMGFGRVLPVTAAFSAVAALALAGVPPLGAGWTKETIVAAAGHDG
ncbi:MAG TPA: proton-conducting transporter membrane subunit, partial [Steroidobacteraceae bacterium]|nr:proton-conducting transporter membrane subunit [Steroidobacteraceae bacterium]